MAERQDRDMVAADSTWAATEDAAHEAAFTAWLQRIGELLGTGREPRAIVVEAARRCHPEVLAWLRSGVIPA